MAARSLSTQCCHTVPREWVEGDSTLYKAFWSVTLLLSSKASRISVARLSTATTGGTTAFTGCWGLADVVTTDTRNIRLEVVSIVVVVTTAGFFVPRPLSFLCTAPYPRIMYTALQSGICAHQH